MYESLSCLDTTVFAYLKGFSEGSVLNLFLAVHSTKFRPWPELGYLVAIIRYLSR